MVFMQFSTKESWEDFQNKMDSAMWGVYSEDAPDGGYWELVYFIGCTTRLQLNMGAQDVVNMLERPGSWEREYGIYREFRRVTGGDIDAHTLHEMDIHSYEELKVGMEDPDFVERYETVIEKVY